MVDAENTLRDLLDKILDERKYVPREVTVKMITSNGANYTSSLYIVNITSPNRNDLKLFAKVACIGETMRVRMQAEWLYNTELTTYTKLTKIYKDLEDQNNISDEHRFVFPKFYGYNAESGKETIVMENLIEEGYNSYNRFNSMDWEHASKSVETLAKFHALSFAFDKYRPEEFKNMVKDMVCPVFGQDKEPDETANAFWTHRLDSVLETLNEDQRDVVRSYVLENRRLSKLNRPIGKPVIAHGDYRLSNLLFRRQNDILQAITVDYQTVHAGCPACDLIYFIFLGSDEEFRGKYYTKLVDHYYSNLEQALERLSVDTSIYSREKFNSDMKELLPYAVLIGVVILPLVTVEVDSAPKVEGDADVSGFLMKPSELFAQRFRGIVNDCIRWGAI